MRRYNFENMLDSVLHKDTKPPISPQLKKLLKHMFKRINYLEGLVDIVKHINKVKHNTGDT